MDVDAILKSLSEKYLAIDSYSDVGTVETVNQPPSSCGRQLEFKTYFVRPDKVRFEWRDWHGVWRVLHDGSAAKSLLWIQVRGSG